MKEIVVTLKCGASEVEMKIPREQFFAWLPEDIVKAWIVPAFSVLRDNCDA